MIAEAAEFRHEAASGWVLEKLSPSRFYIDGGNTSKKGILKMKSVSELMISYFGFCVFGSAVSFSVLNHYWVGADILLLIVVSVAIAVASTVTGFAMVGLPRQQQPPRGAALPKSPFGARLSVQIAFASLSLSAQVGYGAAA